LARLSRWRQHEIVDPGAAQVDRALSDGVSIRTRGVSAKHHACGRGSRRARRRGIGLRLGQRHLLAVHELGRGLAGGREIALGDEAQPNSTIAERTIARIMLRESFT
jgi:hypothetical protein